MLTPTGAKLFDFGFAKSSGAGSGRSDADRGAANDASDGARPGDWAVSGHVAGKAPASTWGVASGFLLYLQIHSLRLMTWRPTASASS